MARTYILGNKWEKWMDGIDAPISIPQNLNTNSNDAITDFIAKTFDNATDDDKIVFSLDSISPEFALIIALHIRLHYIINNVIARLPILFVSRLPQATYLHCGIGSLLFLSTKGVYFCMPNQVKYDLAEVDSLSHSEYKECFLHYIHINPEAKVGHHSIANEWGIGVMAECLNIELPNDFNVFLHRNTLFFKYVQILNKYNTCSNSSGKTIMPLNASHKRILIIDDEAEKGWIYMIKALLNGAYVDTICEKVDCYAKLSAKAKAQIEYGDYDLIFLDLRLNGSKEENVINPMEFSGMNILKEIKNQNLGNQIIIFTASNKAWNMRALLDASADAYYIKESPEFSFSSEQSISNLEELKVNITRCLNNSYLRKLYSKIKIVKDIITYENCFDKKTEEILSSIDIAYDILAKSNGRNEYKAYAYLQLFLIIEEYVKIPTFIDSSDFGLYLYRGEKRYRILKNKNINGNSVSYDSKISMVNGHYVLKSGKYVNRFFDTNFLVSALLIFKFGQENSSSQNWTKIYKARNEKAAHPKSSNVSIEDFDRILNFMQYFFDSKNESWRNPNQAFVDISKEEQLAMLKAKYSQI